MKMVLFLAAGILIGIASPRIAEGTPSSRQSVSTEIHNGPSIKAVQAMIMGEWNNMIGPNPSISRITKDTLWNSQCWSRYKILNVLPGKASKANAYIVEVEFKSSGGPGQCGHADEPSFSIALIPADSVVSGQATIVYWLNCNSAKDFQAALQYPDPRDSNAMCSRFLTARNDHR